MEPLSAAGRGRRGVQEPQRGPRDPADLSPARGSRRVFIAFLAYCLHVTLARRLHALAPGLTPRSVLEKFAAMQMIDVHLPTTDGRELLLTRYTEPEPELSWRNSNWSCPLNRPPRSPPGPCRRSAVVPTFAVQLQRSQILTPSKVLESAKLG